MCCCCSFCCLLLPASRTPSLLGSRAREGLSPLFPSLSDLLSSSCRFPLLRPFSLSFLLPLPCRDSRSLSPRFSFSRLSSSVLLSLLLLLLSSLSAFSLLFPRSLLLSLPLLTSSPSLPRTDTCAAAAASADVVVAEDDGHFVTCSDVLALGVMGNDPWPLLFFSVRWVRGLLVLCASHKEEKGVRNAGLGIIFWQGRAAHKEQVRGLLILFPTNANSTHVHLHNTHRDCTPVTRGCFVSRHKHWRRP